jgi:23S rRNA pseudouridine1911/1915/1917 synthase
MVVHPGAGHASGRWSTPLLHHMNDLSGIGGEMRPASFIGSIAARRA